MITKKERELLDFVYRQGEELIKFLESNNYGDEHKQVSVFVLRGQELNGAKYDYINATSSYWRSENDLERIVTKAFDPCTGKPKTTETKYEKKEVKNE